MSKTELIGRIAVQEGMISREQLRHATREQAHHPQTRLGEWLVDLGYIDEGQLGALLAAQSRLAAESRAARSERPPRRHTPAPVKQAVPEGVRLGSIALKRVAATQFASEPHKDTENDHQKQRAEARTWLLGLLADANKSGASDVLMLPDQPVRLRRFGRLHDFTTGPVSATGTDRLLMQTLSDTDVATLQLTGHVNVAFEAPAVGRFRLQVHREAGGLGGAFHRVQFGDATPSFEDLGLPNWFAGLSNFPHGLVLIVGPAGSGRSTTMTALINLICEERRDHIVVVETPRELRAIRGEALVTQLEVGKHCTSCAEALRDAPRMDADVICLDELPMDAVDAALQAADTDQLVIATLRAPSAARALEMLVDSYPALDQRAARALVADSVKAVVNQRLVPAINRQTTEESGVVLALEVVHIDDGVRELIRTGAQSKIPTHVQSGGSRGSFLLDKTLLDLVRTGRITVETARAHARHPAKFAQGEGDS